MGYAGGFNRVCHFARVDLRHLGVGVGDVPVVAPGSRSIHSCSFVYFLSCPVTNPSVIEHSNHCCSVHEHCVEDVKALAGIACLAGSRVACHWGVILRAETRWKARSVFDEQ